MDIKQNSNKISKDEANQLIKASEDFLRTGTTLIKCPRCGGNIINEKLGNSSVIKCEKEDCLKLTLRGL